MTQPEYEQKKRECWEEFCESDKPYDVEPAFDLAFDRAYALGKQKNNADTVIQGWVARDKRGTICLYNECPERYNAPINEWGTDNPLQYYRIPDKLFPDLTWKSDPIEVELIIKRKKK